MKKFSGLLDGFFETGSEGTHWVLNTGAGVQAKDYGLIFIKPGDHLKVFNEDGSVAFDGKIVPDYKTGWREYPGNPGHGQQGVFECCWWIHWIQKGWRPDDWAKLFIKHWFKEWRGAKQLRAELTQEAKKPKKK